MSAWFKRALGGSLLVGLITFITTGSGGLAAFVFLGTFCIATIILSPSSIH